MNVIWETLGFAARAAIVLVTFAACVLTLVGAARAARARSEGRLEVRSVHDRLDATAQQLREHTLDARRGRAERRRWAKERRQRRARDRRVFVLDFKGDVLASAVEHLREEISAILGVASKDDRVLVRVDSGGGAAHSYGLAAAQLSRLRDRGIPLTVSIDRIAASGGYMMACVADEIVAAPFAIVGSIGVAAPIPNAHRLLQKNGIEYETATAGRYKRTVTFLGAITEEGRRKFQEQLEETHGLFKGFVQRFRPALDVDAVATGEYWHGTRARELGLVDRLATSDDLLLDWVRTTDVFEVRYHPRRSLRARLGDAGAAALERAALSLWQRGETPFV